jgi:hypothetical protein
MAKLMVGWGKYIFVRKISKNYETLDKSKVEGKTFLILHTNYIKFDHEKLRIR